MDSKVHGLNYQNTELSTKLAVKTVKFVTDENLSLILAYIIVRYEFLMTENFYVLLNFSQENQKGQF